VAYNIAQNSSDNLGHMLRRSNDSIAKQTLQWTLQGHRRTPGETNVDSRFHVQTEAAATDRLMIHWQQLEISEILK